MQASATLNRVEELLSQLFQPDVYAGEAYLKTALSPDVFALFDLNKIQQTTVVPATQVTPVPNQPEWVIGLINLQNTVLMAIDLPQFLGLPMLPPLTQQYHIVVVRAQSLQQEWVIAFVVQRIQGLLKVMPEKIQSSSTGTDSFPSQLSPYVQGILAGDEQTESLILLKVQSIAQQILDWSVSAA